MYVIQNHYNNKVLLKTNPVTQISCHMTLYSLSNCWSKTFLNKTKYALLLGTEGVGFYFLQGHNFLFAYLQVTGLSYWWILSLWFGLHVLTNRSSEFQAFSLDFNLRAHSKTHALENYHVCPFPACGKRFTSDFKLKCHIKAHEKVCCYSTLTSTFTF